MHNHFDFDELVWKNLDTELQRLLCLRQLGVLIDASLSACLIVSGDCTLDLPRGQSLWSVEEQKWS